MVRILEYKYHLFIRPGGDNRSSMPSSNTMKDKMEELYRNPSNILEAVKNLNERLETVEQKFDIQKIDEIKELLNSQTIIDEIIVKNSDDIKILMKVRNDNVDYTTI